MSQTKSSLVLPARSLSVQSCKFLCLPDIVRAIHDDDYMNEQIVPLLKVGRDRGDSPAEILRHIVGGVLCDCSGESTFVRQLVEQKQAAAPILEVDNLLTPKSLDALVCPCGQCNAQELYFRSKCHPMAPLGVKYHKDGIIIIFCRECLSPAATIIVAESN